ncbi:MAG TPA: hypothetical protein VH475_07365, partial [Tepidisphaeraceae bacterium]
MSPCPNIFRLSVALLLVLLPPLAGGCGPLKTRSAVPKDQLRAGLLDGYGDVRYWGDEPSEELHQAFIESWNQERVALG